MKKVNEFLIALKSEWNRLNITAEEKKALCEDAKTFISAHVTGLWEKFAIEAVNELEGFLK